MDLSRVVDEDLTEVSDAELLARVGAFLEAQEGHALRRPGPDPERLAVARTLMDPLAELYDPSALHAAVTAWLALDRDRGHAALFAKARPARDTMMARVRLFCALRGLPLPYRLTGPELAFERGLVEALTPALRPGGAERLVILSDLRGLTATGPAARALRLATARKRRVSVVLFGEAPGAAVLTALRAARVEIGRGERPSGPDTTEEPRA